MPRKIKGYDFIERWRDSDNAFEEYKEIKLLKGVYGEQIKVLNLVNQYGRGYRDIYKKKNARPVRKLNSMFGSYMNFKDEKGNIIGDTILIKEKK